jgi:hypothetical protein
VAYIRTRSAEHLNFIFVELNSVRADDDLKGETRVSGNKLISKRNLMRINFNKLRAIEFLIPKRIERRFLFNLV